MVEQFETGVQLVAPPRPLAWPDLQYPKTASSGRKGTWTSWGLS